MKSRLYTMMFCLSAGLLTVPLGAVAADTIFMHISDIEGSATERNHNEWHPLTSVDWSVERPVDMTDQASGVRPHANTVFSKFTLTRQYDYSTPHFFLSVANGTVRPEIILHFTRLGDTTAQGLEAYMIVTLKNAIIDKLSHSASADGIPEETIVIAFSGIEIETKKLDENTGRLVTHTTATWNLQTGSPE